MRMTQAFIKKECLLALDRAIEDEEAGLKVAEKELAALGDPKPEKGFFGLLWELFFTNYSEEYEYSHYNSVVYSFKTNISKLKSFKQYIESSSNEVEVYLTHSEFKLISSYYQP